MKAMLIPADLSKPVEIIDWDGTFASMYEQLGCEMIEHSYPPDHEGFVMLCDEEAFCHDIRPEVNTRVDPLCESSILGNVAIVGAVDDDGDYTRLSQDVVDVICKALAIPTITI